MTDLRKEARKPTRRCLIRLPGCTQKNTCLAHYRLAGYSGTGQKPPDIMGAIACPHCHDLVDGRKKSEHSRDIIRLAHAEGCLRTAALWIKEGLIQ